MWAYDGTLWGNGKECSDEAGGFGRGDRMGFLLDLDDGSLRFFKNGVEHGPGYPAGSVAGPVAQMRRGRPGTRLDASGRSRHVPTRAWGV